ncbi:6-phosphofructokinase [Fulvivirga kasyanovii]|uniref:ATP-dependent 6-phosphofructokinase n=1 Tax=Fulvivirga kasyanovii TaxID=396812 RepID=A0ABW9RQK4_9BACT|nr:6-phosphofructokinase [Fulvivirga kasyanovii]MTI26022.1 6-phosphofructokinase [Fulvivirga kasyanovii]
MSTEIKKIAVFTSGGDAPGMNAAIRAVVRASIYYDKEVFAVYRGYEGMIDNDIVPLDARSVGNIIQRGGTILKSARSKEFRTPEGRKQAYDNLRARGIDALVGIGGDGTFTGLHKFYEEFNMPVICIPGTIDNDLPGTDYTIGYDTATNTAVEAIDKIRDTALSHNRLFFIEVMGRDSGYIAINSGIAGGAIAAIIPEEKMTTDELIAMLDKSDKRSSLVIVAEGGKSGSAIEIAKQVNEKFSYYDTKVTILGHLQRGGSPSYFDRVLASKMGIAAIEGLIQGKTDVMVGVRDKTMVYNDFNTTMNKDREIEPELLRIAKILSI